jgi:hypothetical protein
MIKTNREFLTKRREELNLTYRDIEWRVKYMGGKLAHGELHRLESGIKDLEKSMFSLVLLLSYALECKVEDLIMVSKGETE